MRERYGLYPRHFNLPDNQRYPSRHGELRPAHFSAGLVGPFNRGDQQCRFDCGVRAVRGCIVLVGSGADSQCHPGPGTGGSGAGPGDRCHLRRPPQLLQVAQSRLHPLPDSRVSWGWEYRIRTVGHMRKQHQQRDVLCLQWCELQRKPVSPSPARSETRWRCSRRTTTG